MSRPAWLSNMHSPQLCRVTNDGPDRWSLTVWSYLGSRYELRVWPNADSAVTGEPLDRFRFYTAIDDGTGCNEWLEVVTHTQAREDQGYLEMAACQHHDFDDGLDGPHICAEAESAVKHYVETHHMVHGDSAIWDIKQHLLRVWNALTLLVGVGP